jgi:uncharacterized protein YndB with AHSA1/START domain
MPEITFFPPRLAEQPYRVTVERQMLAEPAAIYRAWTEQFDLWFAMPGHVHMRAEVGEPFVFQTSHEDNIEPHYGRFLALEPDRLVKMTWMTGRLGTAGAETVVTVELIPNGTGTDLRLTHTGFYDQNAADKHEQAWVHHVLPHLDQALAASGA